MLDRSEKRLDVRQRVLKDGKLVINPPSGTLDVKIRDLSRGGARIELPTPFEIPTLVALVAVHTSTITNCAVVWQRGLSVGLRFLEPARKLGIRKY